jgi:hypothetical protein
VRRPTHTLIAAAFAGEPFTEAEARRLLRRSHHTDRIDAMLVRAVPPDGNGNGAAGDEYERLRKMILRDLRRYTVPELRGCVRSLLVLLGIWDELRAASEGRERALRKQLQDRGKQSGATRRATRTSVLTAVNEIKRRNPALTTAAAVLNYLKGQDPKKWYTFTDREQDQRVKNLERKLRRAKKRADTN